MLTEKQLAQHKRCITGSKVASILGLSKWQSKYECFARMKGMLPETESTMIMKAGSYAEDMIQRWCENEWSWHIEKPRGEDGEGWKMHKSYDFLGGYIDRLKYGQHFPDSVLEFKNVGEYVKKEWSEGIPIYNRTQMHFYSILWDLPAIAVACFGGNMFEKFELPRNPDIEAFILEKCVEFWDDLEHDRWPEPDASKSAEETLKAIYMLTNDIMLPGDQEIYEHACRYEEWKKKGKQAEENMRLHKNIITNRLGKHSGFVFDTGESLTWKKTKDVEAFDLNRFKDEQPKMYERYKKTRPGSRQFRVKLREN